MKRIAWRIGVSGVLATWCAGAAPSAQQRPAAPSTQQPIFRSTTDLVQVDVVAVDKDGNPVRGLKAEDFKLFDRKKAQPIATFEEFSHERPREDAAAPAPPPTVKRDVSNNQSAQSDRLVVIVIDDLHIYKGRTDRTKEIATKVVEDLGPSASMAVLYSSGQRSVEVTEDRSELLASIDKFTARRPFPRPILAFDNLRGKSPDPAIGIAEFYDDMNTYKTLQDAARMLGAGDGRRKAFVFVSEYIAKDLSGIFGAMAPAPEGPVGDVYSASGAGDPDGPPALPSMAYHDNAIVDMMDAMRRSNVATYAIDPRGYVSPKDLMRECHPAIGYLEDPCLGGSNSPADWSSWVRQAQHGLEMTAKASGGFAITNTDDFTGGLKRIISDLDHYYLLGFYPPDPNGKGYRQLDVQVVNRPDITLRFRHGYAAGGPPPPPKNADPLVALSAGVMPKTDLPLRLSAVPLPLRGAGAAGRGAGSAVNDARVAVVLEVSVARQALTSAAGTLGDSLKYTVLAARLKDGKIAKQFTNTGTLSSKGPRKPGQAGAAAADDTVAFQFPVELTLAPGRYQLRASATSESLGKGGSVYLALEVPDFTAAPLSVSGLALGYADGSRVTVASGPANRSASSLPLDPTLDREFLPADTLRVYFEIASRLTSGPGARATVELLDDKGGVLQTFRPQLINSTVDLEVPLKGLTAGGYILRATATRGGTDVHREIAFIVK